MTITNILPYNQTLHGPMFAYHAHIKIFSNFKIPQGNSDGQNPDSVLSCHQTVSGLELKSLKGEKRRGAGKGDFGFAIILLAK